jgi:ArsR family metal-binding transcriptional regulator
MFVDSLEITTVLPCLADPRKIRFHARPAADLSPALPYLNAVLPKAVYHHAALALTFAEEYRTICLQPHLITGAKADDVEDARRLLDWLKALINETWERRDGIVPSYERRERLTPLPLFKLLPKGDCGACGLPTCLAFAVELAAERVSVLRCAPLFDAAHQGQRRILLDLLANAGYEVPSAFRAVEAAD